MRQLRAEVLELAFEHFRRCGDGCRECVVYFTADLHNLSLIDGVVHPAHSAGAGGYDLSSAAIADLWRQLLDEHRTIQLQAHTHPGPSYHSARDDALALVNSTGALSLVIPNFALGPVGFEGAFLAHLDADGQWREASIAETLELVE